MLVLSQSATVNAMLWSTRPTTRTILALFSSSHDFHHINQIRCMHFVPCEIHLKQNLLTHVPIRLSRADSSHRRDSNKWSTTTAAAPPSSASRPAMVADETSHRAYKLEARDSGYNNHKNSSLVSPYSGFEFRSNSSSNSQQQNHAYDAANHNSSSRTPANGHGHTSLQENFDSFADIHPTQLHDSIRSTNHQHHHHQHLSLPDPEVLAAKVRRPGDTSSHTLSPPPPWPSPPKRTSYMQDHYNSSSTMMTMTMAARRDSYGLSTTSTTSHHNRSPSASPPKSWESTNVDRYAPMLMQGQAQHGDESAHKSVLSHHSDSDTYRVDGISHFTNMDLTNFGPGVGSSSSLEHAAAGSVRSGAQDEPDSVSKAIGLFRCVCIRVCVCVSCSMCVCVCVSFYVSCGYVFVC
jgi:hypothetical protein